MLYCCSRNSLSIVLTYHFRDAPGLWRLEVLESTDIAHQHIGEHQEDDHQHLAVAIKTNQWIVYNSYIPPRQHLVWEGQQALRHLMQHSRDMYSDSLLDIF